MVKLLKKNGKTYVVLEGNYNVIKAREGLYIVYSGESISSSLSSESKNTEQSKRQNANAKKVRGKDRNKTKEVDEKKDELNDKEIDLLIKVSLIRFVDREWNKVMSLLSKGEQIILKSLIKRGFVKTFKKNGKQFISFTEDMYEKLKEETKKRIKKEEPKVVNIDNSFMIIPKEFIQKYTRDLDMSRYSYVVDSEGTLFIASKKKAKQLYKKIINALKNGKMRYDELANKASLPMEVALIMLKIMCEEGIVYEPEKNVFEVVE